MPEADKIFGKFLPETIDPPERVCFVIEIPDTLQYRAALMGQLEWLADWRCWEHTQADYADPPARNLEAAQLFAIAVTDGRFDECGVMSCDDVQDCIETDAGVQGAIQGMITQSQGFPAEYPYGQNIPSAAGTRDMAAGTNPTCDLDILWSQCKGVVQNTNLAITDVLEKVEVSTNVVELGNNMVQAVPLIGTAKDIIGVSGVLDLINYFQESVAEGYAAQYTTTPGGVEDQIACAIFCACKVDCQITIDRIVGVLQARLAVYTSPPSLAGFVDFVETIAGVSVDTTFVVDMAFFVAWGAIKVANFFFGQVFNNALDIIIALKADEPSNDWETLCPDCPDEWEHRFDFTIDQQGWQIHAPYGAYVPATGFTGDGTPLAWIYRDWVGANQITAVRFETTGGDTILHQVGTPEPALTYFVQGDSVTPNNDYTTDLLGVAGFDAIEQIVCRPNEDGAAVWNGTLIAITLYGYGTEPSW